MSTPYKVIHTTDAPGAVAPYSQAVVHNGVAYVSGCIPFTPRMKLVEGGIEEQTVQALNNLVCRLLLEKKNALLLLYNILAVMHIPPTDRES